MCALPRKRTFGGAKAMSAQRTCYPPSGVGISLLQKCLPKRAHSRGRIHSVIVPANPDTAWSPSGRYPAPAVVTVSGGEDWSSDEEEPVVATHEEMVAMYERPMMEEVGVMPVTSVPAAHSHRVTHVRAVCCCHRVTHVTARAVCCHGKRGQ